VCESQRAATLKKEKRGRRRKSRTEIEDEKVSESERGRRLPAKGERRMRIEVRILMRSGLRRRRKEEDGRVRDQLKTSDG